jgi:hypothetical protein
LNQFYVQPILLDPRRFLHRAASEAEGDDIARGLANATNGCLEVIYDIAANVL